MNPELPTTTPPPLIPREFSPNPTYREMFEGLLRHPKELARALESSVLRVPLQLSMIALLSFLVYGLILGCFAKQQQFWAAPLKISVGMIFAALICFPSLYVFSTLAGGKFSPKLLCTYLAGSLALMGLLLLGFAPAVWIFAESTNSLGFMGFLALIAWMISFGFAIRFLRVASTAQGATQSGPMIVWAIVFCLVTLQLSTSLRPILGRSEHFLQLNEKRFFLQHWVESMPLSLDETADESSASNGQRGTETTAPESATPTPENTSNPFLEK